MTNEEQLAEARKFLATPNMGKSMARELDKALIHIRRLADIAEAAEVRVKELEAQAKDRKAEQVFRISELQELGEAQARIAELEAGFERLQMQIEEARTAWWSATEQGDSGLVYTDRIEEAMDDIWSAIGGSDWVPVESEGE